MASIIDISILSKGSHLWNKEVMDGILFLIQEFKNRRTEQSHDKAFQKFHLELNMSNSNFIKKIRDLPLIMKCRTKFDNSSHFGGQECAEFMKSVGNICDNYINSSLFASDTSESSIPFMVRKIRERATSDEAFAWSFEQKAKKEYMSTGKDITLSIFDGSGYTFQSDLRGIVPR